tara:strand:- start:1554 stop:1877 length:324 start_codon:yes stop_codon:yes gene_type:complete
VVGFGTLVGFGPVPITKALKLGNPCAFAQAIAAPLLTAISCGITAVLLVLFVVVFVLPFAILKTPLWLASNTLCIAYTHNTLLHIVHKHFILMSYPEKEAFISILSS